MAWGHVQTATGVPSGSGGVTSVTATFSSNVTAGNVIRVVVANNQHTTAATISDNKNTGNYTQDAKSEVHSQCILAWKQAAIGGSGFAVTATYPGLSYPSIVINEFSIDSGTTITSVSTTPGNHNANSSASAGATVTPTGSDLVFCGVEFETTGTCTAGTSMTLSGVASYASGTNMGAAAEYALNYSSPINPAMTVPWDHWDCAAAVLHAAVASSGNPVDLIICSGGE